MQSESHACVNSFSPHGSGFADAESMLYDVIIIGGGAAGLSAGLWLGRCRRKVVIFDHGRPRNRKSEGVHGFFTRDNTHPADLLKLGREQLEPYGVPVIDAEVKSAKRLKRSFKVTLLNGEIFHAKKLLIATGVTDEVPMLKGAAEIYGKSMHHCPYCDGWEWRDKPIAVFGRGRSGFILSQRLLHWSGDVVLVTHGPSKLTKAQFEVLNKRGIRVYDRAIQELRHNDGLLESILFSDGSALERSAMFFTTGQHQRSNIGIQLGCEFSNKGTFLTDKHEGTNVEGVFVAGDASKDMQFVIIAAAEGTRAAISIHEALLLEEHELKM